MQDMRHNYMFQIGPVFEIVRTFQAWSCVTKWWIGGKLVKFDCEIEAFTSCIINFHIALKSTIFTYLIYQVTKTATW